jgi:hypothetical protein
MEAIIRRLAILSISGTGNEMRESMLRTAVQKSLTAGNRNHTACHSPARPGLVPFRVNREINHPLSFPRRRESRSGKGLRGSLVAIVKSKDATPFLALTLFESIINFLCQPFLYILFKFRINHNFVKYFLVSIHSVNQSLNEYFIKSIFEIFNRIIFCSYF